MRRERGGGGRGTRIRIVITVGNDPSGHQRRLRRRRSIDSRSSSTSSVRIGLKRGARTTDRTLETADGSAAKDGRGRVSRRIRGDRRSGGSAEPKAQRPHSQSAIDESKQRAKQAHGTESQANTGKHAGRCVGSRPEGRGRGSATANYERRGHNAKGHVDDRHIVGRHDSVRETAGTQQGHPVQNDDRKQTETREGTAHRNVHNETQSANANKEAQSASCTERQHTQQPASAEAKASGDEMGWKQQQQQQPSTDESSTNDTMGRQQRQQQPSTDESTTATAATTAAAADAAATAAHADAASEAATMGHRHIRKGAYAAAMETRPQRRQEVEGVKATQRRSQRWDNQAWRRDYEHDDRNECHAKNYDKQYDERYHHSIDRSDPIIVIKEPKGSFLTAKDAAARWAAADAGVIGRAQNTNVLGKEPRNNHSTTRRTQVANAMRTMAETQEERASSKEQEKQVLQTGCETPAHVKGQRKEQSDERGEIVCPRGNERISEGKHRRKDAVESRLEAQQQEDAERKRNCRNEVERCGAHRQSDQLRSRGPHERCWRESNGGKRDGRCVAQQQVANEETEKWDERRFTHRGKQQGEPQEDDERRETHRHKQQDERRETHRQQQHCNQDRRSDARIGKEQGELREQDERRETHRRKQQDEKARDASSTSARNGPR